MYIAIIYCDKQVFNELSVFIVKWTVDIKCVNAVFGVKISRRFW